MLACSDVWLRDRFSTADETYISLTFRQCSETVCGDFISGIRKIRLRHSPEIRVIALFLLLAKQREAAALSVYFGPRRFLRALFGLAFYQVLDTNWISEAGYFKAKAAAFWRF